MYSDELALKLADLGRTLMKQIWNDIRNPTCQPGLGQGPGESDVVSIYNNCNGGKGNTHCAFTNTLDASFAQHEFSNHSFCHLQRKGQGNEEGDCRDERRREKALGFPRNFFFPLCCSDSTEQSENPLAGRGGRGYTRGPVPQTNDLTPPSTLPCCGKQKSAELMAKSDLMQSIFIKIQLLMLPHYKQCFRGLKAPSC